MEIDQNKRTSLNTVFGDKITSNRIPSISQQFQYGFKSDEANITENNGGNVLISDSLLTLQTGANSSGEAIIESVKNVRYVPGHETYCMFTAVFSEAKLNSYQRAGLFDENNGFFIEVSEDTNFYFVRRRNGTDYKQKINLIDFNNKNFNLDITKGNIYRITYGYLGFAPISLEVSNKEGAFVPLSKITYPNEETETHTTQTFLPIRGEVKNNGNTSNIILKSGSITAGIINGNGTQITGRNFGYSNSVPYAVDENTNLVAFRNKTTYKGIENKVIARLIFMSGANDLNKNVRWTILKNPTLDNTETWTDINTTDSIMEYSVNAVPTSPTTDERFISWNKEKSSDFFEKMEDLKLNLLPGQIALFRIEGTGAGEADLSIRWDEKF